MVQQRGGTVAFETIGLDPSALSSWPGPALLLSRDGGVIAANDLADPLRRAVVEGRLNNLATVAERALIMPGANGGNLILELAVLPARSGRTLILARDVTLERNLRSALVESRQRYKDLVEISSDFAWEVGADGRFVFVSPKGALGYGADELVGRHPDELLLGREPGVASAVFGTQTSTVDVEVWVRSAGGGEACLLSAATPIRAEDGHWVGARGVCRDVTQERLREAALTRANNRERLLSYIVRTIRDEVEPQDMLRVAAEATARAINATGCRIWRSGAEDGTFVEAAHYGEAGPGETVVAELTAGRPVDGMIGGWSVLSAVSRYRHAINGGIALWRTAGKAGWSDDDRLLIDDVGNQIGLAIEQIANHERILKLSRTDSLTGLFNRRAFFEEVNWRFQRLQREDRPAALIYADLDNFKSVNDAHGHQAGDRALQAARDVLLHHTRPGDLVARLGGDEFAMWLDGADEAVVVRRAQAILTAARTLRQYSGCDDKPLHVSLGAAVYNPGGGETLDDLLARADRAMYDAKHDGKGDWRLAAKAGE